ncbi:MAG: hypothetical protein KGL53_04475, partial [Elusimicrobia bacterium]|nr:hypothetical protein [Elusimicrobiota bacterium]
IVGAAIHDTPVVGHVLRFGEATGQSIWSALQAAPQTFVYAATGDGRYGVSAAANWGNVAPMRWLIGADGNLDRLNDDSWDYLLPQARERREKALRQAGYTAQNTDPAAYARMLNRWDGRGKFATRAACLQAYDSATCERFMYSTAELTGSLGAFTMSGVGGRLIDEGVARGGWTGTFESGAGWALRVTDNIGQTAFNPVIWATWGAGAGVGIAARGGSLLGLGAAGTARVATALSALHTAGSALLYTTWAVGGVDNLGQTVNAIRSGDKAQAWKKGADLSTDIFFLGMMAYEGRTATGREAATDAMGRERAALLQDYDAARAAVDAPDAALPAADAVAPRAEAAPR